MLATPIGRVRAAGLVEGVSALILYFIAVPMKRVFHMAEGHDAVLWVGSIHGGLFILYAFITFVAWGKGALTAKLVGYAAVAAILPFGPFVIDGVLKRYEERTKLTASPATE